MSRDHTQSWGGQSYFARSDSRCYITGWLALSLSLVLAATIAFSFPRNDLHQTGVLFGLGAVALWRYSWAAVNFVRAIWFRMVRFPQMREQAVGAPRATHVYVVILSFRMDSRLNSIVYGALLRDLNEYGARATIVACVSDAADVAQLKMLSVPTTVHLIPLQQSRRGKRDAMERALDTLANMPTREDALVILMDGDTLVPLGTLGKVAPLLLADPRMGALTTHNAPVVEGSNICREWFRLRMMSRHVLMCSIALSRRVLVLTGRYSVFRAEIGLSRGFIAAIGRDQISTDRQGRILMLTGDDKSTWFWTLRAGWDMTYVPDVSVICCEKQPHPTFFSSSSSLFARWYGNMARNSSRAIGIGPRSIGLFTWISLIDQRISPWTTLSSPAAAAVLLFTGQWGALALYPLWLLGSRTAQTFAVSHRFSAFHPFFPFLQVYNQLYGSMLKVNAFFNPQKQKWTRQATSEKTEVASTNGMMWLSIAVMLLLVLTMAVV